MSWFYLSLFFAIWTSISISVVKRLTNQIGTLAYLLASGIFILPFQIILIYVLGGVPHIFPKFYLFITFSSVLDVIAFTASTWAIMTSPISLISPLSSFNPVFTTIFAMLTLKEIPTPTKILGIFIVVIGVYLLNISDIKKGFLTPFIRLFSSRGVQLFFLANIIWSITPIFQKKAIFQTEPVMPFFTSFIGGILITLFILPFTIKKFSKNLGLIRKNILWFIIPAPFTVIASWAAFTAFSLTNVSYATAVFKLSTLFVILWGAIFFKEERIKERLLGGIVMIIGVILLVGF